MADSWIKDFIPLFTGLMGGGFGLSGVYLANRMNAGKRDREALDAWWEKYAIEECIEPLINYLGNVGHRLIRHYGVPMIPDSKPIPDLALFRLQNLTNWDLSGLLKVSELAVEYGLSEAEITDLQDKIDKTQSCLLEISGLLLDYKISKKSDVLSINKNQQLITYRQTIPDYLPDLKAMAERLVAKADAIQKTL